MDLAYTYRRGTSMPPLRFPPLSKCSTLWAAAHERGRKQQRRTKRFIELQALRAYRNFMPVHFYEVALLAGVLADAPLAADTETRGISSTRDCRCGDQIRDGKRDEQSVRCGTSDN